MITNTNSLQEPLVKRLYYHWSYGVLCVWCLVGILLGVALFIQTMSDSHFRHEGFIAGIIGLSALISGGYISIVEGKEKEIFEIEFAETRQKVRDGFVYTKEKGWYKP